MTARTLLILPALALLAACGGSSGGKVASASGTADPVKVVVRAPITPSSPGKACTRALGGAARTGAPRAELIRQFGTARLDVWEGDARKLQFIGTACVLDVYLYPAQRGAEPQATYLDARRPSDGQDVDRAACVAALRKS